MSINNNRSWVHQANKNRTEEQDRDLKFHIAGILKQNFNIDALTDYVYLRNRTTNKILFLPKEEVNLSLERVHEMYEVNLPDLIVKIPKLIIFELDGDYHINTQSGIDQTVKRNKNYGAGGFFEEYAHNLVILDSSQYTLDDNSIAEILSSKLDMRIKK